MKGKGYNEKLPCDVPLLKVRLGQYFMSIRNLFYIHAFCNNIITKIDHDSFHIFSQVKFIMW